MSERTPPENYDYYKLRGRSGPTPIARPPGAPRPDRQVYVFAGVFIQLFGGGIALAGINSNSQVAEVIGGLIGWVGTMLLFIGLVAIGVRLGTEELREVASRYTSADQS